MTMQNAQFSNERGLFRLGHSYDKDTVAKLHPCLDLEEGVIAVTTKRYAAVYRFEAALFDCSVTLHLCSPQEA
jgi:hypothetical protein